MEMSHEYKTQLNPQLFTKPQNFGHDQTEAYTNDKFTVKW